MSALEGEGMEELRELLNGRPRAQILSLFGGLLMKVQKFQVKLSRTSLFISFYILFDLKSISFRSLFYSKNSLSQVEA